MKCLLVLLISILSEHLFAQYTFRFEYDSIRTFPTSFVEIEDGYIIAGGIMTSQGDFDYNLMNSQLIKINKKGEFQWSKENDEPLYNNIFSIKYDGQNIFGVGVSFVEEGRSKTYFLKFDKNGNLILKKEIGTISYTSRDNLPTDLLLLKDGTILLNNSEYSFITGNTECVTYKMDKEGEILNRIAFSQNTLSCIPYDLIETTDNGCVVVMSAVDLNLLEEKIYLLKFDYSGNEVWRELIETIDPVQTDFSLSELNNFIFCAMATNYVNGGPSRLSLVKYDKNGNVLFETNYANYSPPTPESFDFPKISLNRDSTGFLIFGDFAGSYTVFNPTILFVDLNGHVLNSKTYLFPGTIGNGWACEMHTTEDNGIAMLARNFHYTPIIGSKAEFIKTDCQGNLEWRDECSFVDTDSDVLIFPNPSNGAYSFQLQNITENTNVELEIYDNVGKIVFKYTYKASIFMVDLSLFSTGIYQYKLIIDKNIYSIGKLMKIE